jgi:hypothetical protein
MKALPVSTLVAPLLLGLACLAGPSWGADPHPEQAKKAQPSHAKKTPASKSSARHAHAGKGESKGRGKSTAPRGAAGPLADLRDAKAGKDVVQVANWVSSTYDSGRKPFVIIDKKAAHAYVIDGWGRLWSSTPVLVGSAKGDDAAPGVGAKRLAQLKPDERTTSAGRFVARRGKDTRGANVVWIDYDAALSMHALASVSASERRAERLATPDPSDNRISTGCINFPPKFFTHVLWPPVSKIGVVVYVLPETRSVEQQFGAYDVTRARARAA